MIKLKHRNYAALLLFGLALSAPLLLFMINGISLVGMGEESVGYRYFYSLRILYEETGAPDLPQGHLVSVIHALLQYILTIVGFLKNDIQIRINVFSYIASFLPIIATLIVYYWATKSFNNSLKIILALLMLITTYQLRIGGGYHLVIPDYYIWALPVSIVALGFSIREITTPGYMAYHWFPLGLYVAACLTLKITYLIMPAMLFFLMLGNFKMHHLRSIIKIAPLVLISSLLIFLLYYRGSILDALKHFDISYYTQFYDFNNPSYTDWLKSMILEHHFDICTLTALLPYILFCSLFLHSYRKIKIALLLPAIFLCCVAYKRPYPPTFVETSNFVLVITAIFVFCHIYSYNNKTRLIKRMEKKHLNIYAIVILFIVNIVTINNFFHNFYGVYKISTNAEIALRNYLTSYDGKALFVIVNNDYRPTTVDSAIFKGAMRFDNNIWPTDGLVNSFVADRSYIVNDFNPSIDIPSFSKLVFVAAENSISKQKDNIKKLYGIDFSKYNCDFNYGLDIGGVNWFVPYVKFKISTKSFYYPSDASVSRVIIGCKRIP